MSEAFLHLVREHDVGEAASAPSAAWNGANRRYLDAELRRLTRRRGEVSDPASAVAEASNGDAIESELDETRGTSAEPFALDRLQARFALSAFERDLVLWCAGHALDPALVERHGSSTFSLAMTLAQDLGSVQQSAGLASVAEDCWQALSPGRPLRRHRLIEMGGGDSLLFRPLRLDERVLRYLLGIPGVDVRLEGVLRPMAPALDLMDSHHQLACVIDGAWRGRVDDGAWPVIELWGADAQARRSVAAEACRRLGWPLYELRLHGLGRELDDAELARLLAREARLDPVALFVDEDSANPADPGAPGRLRRLIEDVGAPIVLASRERGRQLARPAIAIEVRRPGPDEQRARYRAALAAEGLAERPGASRGIERVVAQFDVSAPAIPEVCAMVRRRTDDGADLCDALWDACREATRTHTGELAQRSDARATWRDLVVGERQRSALHEIALQVRNRGCVHDTWGFGARGARGTGITALFAGPSGVGKTLAAEVLATELRLDLYRIDLSQVVSKYIGETERNLRRVFDAAESGGAVLLFDEADALFGKRSEVKDSHDRYANMEVGYLLQRMETYRGLAILTTNERSALDPAFRRRLAFIIEFAQPDEAMRAAIWRTVFPPSTPTEGLDPDRLAKALALSGASIRNLARGAAFHAADAGAPVGPAHIVLAARGEYDKLDRSPPEAVKHLMDGKEGGVR